MVVAEVPVGGEACGDTFSSTDVRLSEISSRLLQGWTLLSQPCPVPCCNTPLLRDTKKGAQGEVREKFCTNAFICSYEDYESFGGDGDHFSREGFGLLIICFVVSWLSWRSLKSDSYLSLLDHLDLRYCRASNLDETYKHARKHARVNLTTSNFHERGKYLRHGFISFVVYRFSRCSSSKHHLRCLEETY